MIWLLHVALAASAIAASALTSDAWTLGETQAPEPQQERQPSLVPS